MYKNYKRKVLIFIVDKKLIQELDPETGELIGRKIEVDLESRRKVKYNRNDWLALHQKEIIMLNEKNMFNAKGKVFMYLISIVEYSNFAPFNMKHAVEKTNLTRQTIYKSLNELLDDHLIVNAINEQTGIKGYYISDVYFQKGEREDKIKLIYREKDELELIPNKNN